MAQTQFGVKHHPKPARPYKLKCIQYFYFSKLQSKASRHWQNQSCVIIGCFICHYRDRELSCPAVQDISSSESNWEFIKTNVSVKQGHPIIKINAHRHPNAGQTHTLHSSTWKRLQNLTSQAFKGLLNAPHANETDCSESQLCASDEINSFATSYIHSSC